MQIILTENCTACTGALGRGFGYHIQRRKNGFFSKRNSKGAIPYDGHWKFILACAELAQYKLHIDDIRVARRELHNALREANLPSPAFLNWNNVEIYNASDIINFQRDHLPNLA